MSAQKVTDRTKAAEEVGARERLLAMGAELFADRGFAATSVREICQAAGVTKPTLYYYFGSKSGLAEALLADAVGDLLATLEAVAQGDRPPREKLRAIARIVFERSGEAPLTCRFFYASMFAPRRVGVDFHSEDTIPRIIALTAAVFAEGQAMGVFKGTDPEPSAMILLGALQGYAIRFVRRSDVQLTAALADRIVEGVLGGLAVPSTGEESS